MQRLRGPNDSIIFPTTGQKDPVTRKFLRFSHNGLAPEGIQIDLSHKFDLLILICVTRGRANQGVSAVQKKELA